MPWKPEDTIAVASLVGGIFGRGGGGELSNHCGLAQMAASLPGGAAEARTVFDDLHFANDPEAPTSGRDPFPYMTDLGPVNPAAHPNVDCATLRPIDDNATSLDDLLRAAAGEFSAVTIDAPWGPIALDFNSGMSNAVLVGGKHTQTKRPIAVFGPQTAYFMPQLLVEKDVHGPGIDARGVAFAGTDIYVQLGRGRNYAWSATSSGGDNVDQFILRLCDPAGGPTTVDSMGYQRNGVCEPIETFQHTQIAKPTAGGIPEGPDIVLSWRVDRSEHYGPLVARGTLQDGTPIAVATRRSTYFTELGSAPAFYRMNNPNYVTNGFNSFRQAMGAVQYTFNWFYIDANNIGYQHSCRCQQRAQGVDPYLPPWGTGQWDWQGFIPQEKEPWDLNPSEGWITSWNNKQAPGFMANDRNFGYGPTYRSELLDARLLAAISAGKLDRADVVRVMEEAGTTDLRGQELVPLLLQALGTSPPAGSDPRLAEMRSRLAAWGASGSHHRDLDRSGEYDDAVSPAIMEFWWPELSHAMFDGASGDAIDSLGLEIDDHNRVGHLGSAFQGGTYGHVNKDLRRLLGQPVQAPWSRAYCGTGVLSACRQALWESMGRAAQALDAKYASPDVANWKWALAEEDVRHSAAGVTEVPAIHWINRPTFQQVVQVGVAVPVARSFGAGALQTASGKKIGFAFDVQALVGGEAEGRFLLHDFAARKTLDVRDISSVNAPAEGDCGSIAAGAPNSLEFTGTGKFNGGGTHAVHVCVQDNADPGTGADRLHVACATCPYNTSSAATSEVLTYGNIKVSGGTEAPASAGQPQVITLDPVTGAAAGLGAPVTLTATVYDAAGQPIEGAALSLLPGSGLVNLTPLATATSSDGKLIFTAVALLGVDAEISALVGSARSNPVLVSWR
jgi:acyl-homoserine lactone acylase PvdQ